MRGIIVDRAARVVAGTLEQHLEGDAVADVLARMDLKTEIDASLVIGVQDRTPAARKFVEGGLDHSRRPLRPRIEERPGQRARKADAAFEPEPAGRTGGFDELIDRPTLTFLRSAFDRWRRKGVKGFVIGRMHGHQLSLQVRGQFGDHQAMARGHARDVVAISLRGRCLFEVDQAWIRRRDLNAFVAEPRGPAADGIETVKRRCGASKLRQKDCWPLHGGRSNRGQHRTPSGSGDVPAPINRRFVIRQGRRSFNPRGNLDAPAIGARLQQRVHDFQDVRGESTG